MTGNFHKEWKNCAVPPIFKKRDTKNFRGIALINTLQNNCKKATTYS